MSILFITAAFHFYRGVPVDGWIFLAAGFLVGFDLAHRHRRAHEPAAHQARRREWPWVRNAVLAGAAALSLVVAVAAPVDSAGIPAVVGLVGAVMLVLAWPEKQPETGPGRHAAAPALPVRGGREGHAPGARRAVQPAAVSATGAPAPVRRAAWWWGAVLLFLCLWELGNYFSDQLIPSDAAVFPPLTDLLQPLFDSDASRWLMLLVWLAACAGLLRVVRRP